MPDVWSYLFNVEPGPADALVYVLGVVFAISFVAGLLVYRQRKARYRGSPYLWLVSAASRWATILGGLGVLFAIAAIVNLPIANLRFWLAALAVTGLAVLVWVLYVLLVRMPRDRTRYYQVAQRQRYLPTPTAKKRSKGRRR